MPACFGASGSLRAISIAISDSCPNVVHTFWPFTIHSSPSRTAVVASEAMSDPAPGSENSWHHRSSPVSSGGSRRRLVSSVDHCRIVGAASGSPDPRGTCGTSHAASSPSAARASSSGEPAPAVLDGEVWCHPTGSAEPRHDRGIVDRSAQRGQRVVVAGAHRVRPPGRQDREQQRFQLLAAREPADRRRSDSVIARRDASVRPCRRACRAAAPARGGALRCACARRGRRAVP